jgi:hypothetical protein
MPANKYKKRNSQKNKSANNGSAVDVEKPE